MSHGSQSPGYLDLELRCSSQPSADSYWVTIQTGVRTSIEST